MAADSSATLHASFALGSLTLANRIVMAPMTRNRAGPGNVPQPLNAEYYRQRASAGIIVTEATQVSPYGLGYPGTPGIHDELQVAGWSVVTEAVHDAGGRIVLQLWHVGGRPIRRCCRAARCRSRRRPSPSRVRRSPATA